MKHCPNPECKAVVSNQMIDPILKMRRKLRDDLNKAPDNIILQISQHYFALTSPKCQCKHGGITNAIAADGSYGPAKCMNCGKFID